MPAINIVAKLGGTKAVKKRGGSVIKKSGGTRGFKKFEGDALWLPKTERPEWLDGSLPGDRGFDPLSLGKPQEYVQVDVDQNDIQAEQNKFGEVIGDYAGKRDELSANPLVPYSEAFGIQRFRECELIHGRWCMLACLGVWACEGLTGVAWNVAGKVEADASSYLGFPLPFDLTQLIWIEVLAVGGAEIYRNSSLDPVMRTYPGGYFDPLGLANAPEDKVFKLKEAEIKHGRLAMISFLGFAVQSFFFDDGAFGTLAKFTSTL